jgi:hypothetical protein
MPRMADREPERPPEGPAARREDRRAAARLTAALGVAFAALLLTGTWLLATAPVPRASDAAVVAFYTGNGAQRVLLGGLYLLPFSAVAFLWFVAALRQWAARSGREIDQLFATVQLLSGVGFITLDFAAAGAASVVAASVALTGAPVDPEAARQFPLYGLALLVVFGMRMAAVFVLTTVRIGHAAGLYPRWFVLASYAVAAALLLSASLDPRLIAVFPLWVAVLGAIIWTGTGRRAGEPDERSTARRAR